MDKQVGEIVAKVQNANGVDEVMVICKEYGKLEDSSNRL